MTVVFVIAATLAWPAAAGAAPGDLDLSFSGDGLQSTDFGVGPGASANALARQPDGKLLVAGEAQGDFVLVRFNADGSLDSSFADAGRQTARLGHYERGLAVALQADGKIVVVGSASGAFDTDFGVTRFNSDGSPDATFSGDGKQTTDFGEGHDEPAEVAIQPDGRIVVAGRTVDGQDGRIDGAIARYNPDGSLDPSFAGDGRLTNDFGSSRPDASVNGVAIQADGRIVAAGSTHQSGNAWEFGLARFNGDGSLDTTFSGDGKQTTDFANRPAEGRDVALQADGKIVVAGIADPDLLSGQDFAVARYNADGSLDTGFDGDGKQTTGNILDNDRAEAVAIQADGKIVTAGGFAFRMAAVRYNPDGSLDTSFDGDGVAFTRPTVPAGDVLIQPDGKQVLVGSASTFIVARQNADGSLDTGFAEEGVSALDLGAADGAEDVAVQDDGKLVAAGTAGRDFAVARYDPDGSLDASFSGDGLQTADFGNDDFDRGHALAVQPDGKLVVVGWARGDFGVARFNPDGSLDAAFSGDGLTRTDFDAGSDVAADVALQADGKLLVVGHTTTAGGGPVDTRFALARLNPDGSLDASFSGDGRQTTDLGTVVDSANAVALQADGKIVAVGSASQTDIADFGIARYNPDGSLDESFDADGMRILSFGFRDTAVAARVQSDGKIIVAGEGGLIRLNPDGSVDTTFSGDGHATVDLELVMTTTDAALLPDGKIVVGGSAAIAPGSTGRWDFALARFNPDGSLDGGFSGDGMRTIDFPGASLGSQDTAHGLAVQADGRIVLAGVDARTDFALARVQSGVGPPDTVPPDTILLSGPTGTTADATPRFTFTSTEDSPSFECRIDDGNFARCAPPHWTGQLSPGPHRFEVRARDHWGNDDPSPAQRDFTLEGGEPPPPPPPNIDWDGDGVPNAIDMCPVDAGPPPFGCPPPPLPGFDRDGDGVFDAQDRCPDLPGPAPTGCPGGAAGAVGGGGGFGAGGGPAPVDPPRIAGSSSAGVIMVSRGGGFTLRNQAVDCGGLGPTCSVRTAVMSSLPASASASAKTVKLGGSKFQVAAGKKAIVKATLTRKGLRLLKRRRRIKARVAIAVTRGSAKTNKVVRVTLRAPKRKR